MNLKSTSGQILDQLLTVLDQIKAEDYTAQIPLLNASISQHIRHVVEFYVCLFEGLETGIINYDNRKRDSRIANDISFAITIIRKLKVKINSIKDNSDLDLQIKYGDITDTDIKMKTNLYRELTYNIEHTIHHLAIIKHSIIQHTDYIQLPEHFGLASSTVRHTHKKYQ